MTSFVQSYRSEQFSQNFEKLLYTSGADRFFCLDSHMIHCYSVGWTSAAKSIGKVKSITFRNSFSTGHPMALLDIHPVQPRLFIRGHNSPSQIEYFCLEDSDKEEAVHPLIAEGRLELFGKVVDFYFPKDDSVKAADERAFLVVMTQTSVQVFVEANRQLNNCFSMELRLSNPQLCRFNFIVEHAGTENALKGVFMRVEGRVLRCFVVTGFGRGTQSIVSKQCSFQLDYQSYEQLLNFDVSSWDHVSLLLARPGLMISKYILSMKSGQEMAEVHSKEIRILEKFVESSFFIYGPNDRFLFGALDKDLSQFESYKKLIQQKHGFQTLTGDFEHARSGYRILMNESRLVVVDPQKGTFQSCVITKDNAIKVLSEWSIPGWTHAMVFKQNSVRFVINRSDKLTASVEDQDSIATFKVKFGLQDIEVIQSVCVLNKQAVFGRNDIAFHQLNVLKTPKKTYRVYALVERREVVSVDFSSAQPDPFNRRSIVLDNDVYELYKSKQFPYNLAVATLDETLILLNEKLQVQTSFSLKVMGQYFSEGMLRQPFLDNFNLKHLYDRFYIVGLSAVGLREGVRRDNHVRLERELVPVRGGAVQRLLPQRPQDRAQEPLPALQGQDTELQREPHLRAQQRQAVVRVVETEASVGRAVSQGGVQPQLAHALAAQPLQTGVLHSGNNVLLVEDEPQVLVVPVRCGGSSSNGEH